MATASGNSHEGAAKTMDGIEIREASAPDAAALLLLIDAYWRHDGIAGFDSDRVHRQLQQFLSTPAYGRAWMATLAGGAIGYLLCTFVYSFEHGGLMAEIDELFVEAAYRQRGVGRSLMDTARSALVDHGFTLLQMQVADGNTRSQRFYARLGFKEKSGYRIWTAPLGTQA
jgi:ribosomal protein S18 acetylase RimI-like enzyme